MAPADAWVDISTHGFRKQGTTAMFDVCIVNLESSSYLNTTLENVLAKAEKERKDKYLQPCLEHRQKFTPLV